MKKIMALLLACVMLIALAACGITPEHTHPSTKPDELYYPCTDPEWTTETTYDPNHACTTTATPQMFTSSRDDIEPLYPSVTMFDADGNELTLYSELVYFTDGTVVGDGALILMSVSSRLPAIAEKIPLVNLGGTPEIVKTAREGVSIRGGETVNVYGEDYKLLAERVPLADLWEKGNAEWSGKLVYIYFTVLFTDETPDYEKRTENGYFVKTTFVSHSDVKITGASDELFEVYHEPIAAGPADFELSVTPVAEYLPKIKDKIPLVTLDDNSAIRVMTAESVTPVFSDTVSVYGKDFSLLAENIALATVAERAMEWNEDVLYVYFEVRFEENKELGNLTEVVENGYFAKVSYYQGELPSRLTPMMVIDGEKRVSFYREAVNFTNGFTMGDGPLVFSSIETHLPTIVSEIPDVVIDTVMELDIPDKEGVTVSGGNTFEVYNESYEKLGVYTLSEITSNLKGQWKDMSVYLVLYLYITEECVPVCYTGNVYYLQVSSR